MCRTETESLSQKRILNGYTLAKWIICVMLAVVDVVVVVCEWYLAAKSCRSRTSSSTHFMHTFRIITEIDGTLCVRENSLYTTMNRTR